MMRSFLPTAILALLLCAAAAGIEHGRAARAAEYYAVALSGARIDEVVAVAGVRYQVQGGIVRDPAGAEVVGGRAYPMLRLAYALALARRAPLMTLAGNDPADIRRLTDDLVSLRDTIASGQKDSRQRSLVRDALYPISFLRAMADAEDARLSFLTQGDAPRLAAYLKARGAAFQAYRNDARRYRSAFEALVPHTKTRFSLGEHLVSYEDMHETLSRLPSAMAASIAASRLQEACLAGALSSCDPLELELLTPPRPGPVTVTPQARQQAEEIVHLIRQEPLGADVQAELGTVEVALGGSRCIDTQRSAPLYTVRDATSTVDGAWYRKVLFVGDVNFIDSTSLPSVPFYAFFATHGVRYIPTSPFLHYVCPEFGHELSDVFAIDATSAFAQTARLSKDAPELRSLESALRRGSSADLITDATAHTYLARVADLIRAGALPKDAADAAVELILSVNMRTAGWTDALQFLVETDAANARILKKGVPVDLEAPYVFFFRSPVLFLYMADNPSVSMGLRISGAPAKDANRDPYVYYSALPHTDAFIEEAARDIGVYREIHQEPAEVPLSETFSKWGFKNP